MSLRALAIQVASAAALFAILVPLAALSYAKPMSGYSALPFDCKDPCEASLTISITGNCSCTSIMLDNQMAHNAGLLTYP